MTATLQGERPVPRVADELAELFGVPTFYRLVRRVLSDVTQADHAVRARLVTQRMKELQTFMEWLSGHRDEAVRCLRAEGASYDEIARLLDISKSRAQQICQRLEQDAAAG